MPEAADASPAQLGMRPSIHGKVAGMPDLTLPLVEGFRCGVTGNRPYQAHLACSGIIADLLEHCLAKKSFLRLMMTIVVALVMAVGFVLPSFAQMPAQHEHSANTTEMSPANHGSPPCHAHRQLGPGKTEWRLWQVLPCVRNDVLRGYLARDGDDPFRHRTAARSLCCGTESWPWRVGPSQPLPA